MMSTLPQASIAVWTSWSGASPLARSPAKTAVSPAISPAVCCATSPSRSLMTTLAPWALSSSAVARPMPRAEPVTIATLSSRTPMPVSFSEVEPDVRSAASYDERACRRSFPAPSERQDLGEDLAHDLVGAAADRAQPRVAGHALDLVLLHVAGAAVDLQAGVHDVEAGALRGELGHRDLLDGVALGRHEAPQRVVGHDPRHVDRRGHVGELVAQRLEARQ